VTGRNKRREDDFKSKYFSPGKKKKTHKEENPI
jgi:hypothetical protein